MPTNVIEFALGRVSLYMFELLETAPGWVNAIAMFYLLVCFLLFLIGVPANIFLSPGSRIPSETAAGPACFALGVTVLEADYIWPLGLLSLTLGNFFALDPFYQPWKYRK